MHQVNMQYDACTLKQLESVTVLCLNVLHRQFLINHWSTSKGITSGRHNVLQLELQKCGDCRLTNSHPQILWWVKARGSQTLRRYSDAGELLHLIKSQHGTN